MLLDGTDREQILEIIKQVVDLTKDERRQLLRVLSATTLSRITNTIKLIEDRFETISALQKLVYNEDLSANERDHLQKVIESHYWIFGEQYHLVSAAEPKFEEALRRFTQYLTGENKKTKINHPDKNKEMDIFMCRQRMLVDKIENVVVELKHPTIMLGEAELSQVKKYMNVILLQKEFNANNMEWTFYLIGNKCDSYIKNEMKSQSAWGEKALVHRMDNYKIYVKTWSEIFNEFELKHKFLNDKLELERQNLEKVKHKTARKIVEMVKTNTAAVN